MNNGKKENGVVLDFEEELYLLTDEVKFVSNVDYNLYKQTEDIGLVNSFPKNVIYSIETILK